MAVITAVTAGLGAASTAAAADLRIVSWGGGYQDAMRRAWFEPFQKETGIKMVEDTWDGELGMIRAQVSAGKIAADLYDSDPHIAVEGCDEGVLEPIDTSYLGDLSKFREDAISTCGVGSHVYTIFWSWNEDKKKFGPGGAPATIADILDPKKFPGRRGLPTRIYGIAEWALLADGVPKEKMYEVLAKGEGLERALAKLEPIKKDIVWMRTTSQVPQLLADGEVDFARIPFSNWYDAVTYNKKNFATMRDWQYFGYVTWVVPKGAPNKAQAAAFLKYIMEPKHSARFTNEIAYAWTRIEDNPHVDPGLKDKVTTSGLKNHFFLKRVWWADHLGTYQKRFEAWRQN